MSACRLLPVLLLSTLALRAQEAPVPAAPAAPAARPAPYDEAADGRAQIDAALAAARRENRRVLIQWGGNWCVWCVRLSDLCASDRDIRRKLQYEYDVVHVDIGRRDKHMDLAAACGADLGANGVPYLTVLDADGRVLANQETGSLEVEGQPAHDPAKVLAFLERHQAPYRKAADVRDAALAAAARDGRRVFLHFGAPWCGWCHKLDAWLARPEVAAILGPAFVDAKVDVDRTEGGQALLAAYAGEQPTGIPWFAFLDAEGRVLATSTGPAGNIGFPAAAGEIAHFLGMLRAAAPGLSDADLAVLERSLQPAPAQPAGSTPH